MKQFLHKKHNNHPSPSVYWCRANTICGGIHTHCVPKRAIAASHTQLHTFMPAPIFKGFVFYPSKHHRRILASWKYSIWDNLWTQKSHEIVQLFNHFHDIRCIKKIVIREPMLKKVPGCVSALFSRREKRCNNTFERISASFAKRNSLLNVTNPWADEWCKSFLNCLRVRDVAFVA